MVPFLFKNAVKLLVCEARSASDPAGKSYIIARSPTSCFNLGSSMGGPTEYIYIFGGTTQLKHLSSDLGNGFE